MGQMWSWQRKADGIAMAVDVKVGVGRSSALLLIFEMLSITLICLFSIRLWPKSYFVSFCPVLALNLLSVPQWAGFLFL